MKRIILFFTASLLFLFSVTGLAQDFPVEVGKKWDAVLVAPDTDWFASDLAPSSPSQRTGMASRYNVPVKHTFQFSCPTATVINLQMKYNAITSVHNFNGGVEIGANDGVQRSIILHSGMTYNIQHKTATQACKVIITESFDIKL